MSAPATARQIETIIAMATERGMPADRAARMAAALDKTDASWAIDSLKRQPKVPAAPAAPKTRRVGQCPDGCCFVEVDEAGNVVDAA